METKGVIALCVCVCECQEFTLTKLLNLSIDDRTRHVFKDLCGLSGKCITFGVHVFPMK